ncbi:MAG: glycerol-3-phosphate acyltransferase [Candidatus Hydrothermales bacterium]
MDILNILIFSLFGYTVGSIPFSYIVSKLKGLDIRKVGTGNVGGANVLRSVGVVYGIIAFLLDFLKGFFSSLIPFLLGFDKFHSFLCGFFAVIGHSYPIFLKFQGGRGIATSLGFLVFLFPKETLIVLAILSPLVFLREIALYILFFIFFISIYIFLKFKELGFLSIFLLLFVVFRRVQFVYTDVKNGRPFLKSFVNRLLFDAPEKVKF